MLQNLGQKNKLPNKYRLNWYYVSQFCPVKENDIGVHCLLHANSATFDFIIHNGAPFIVRQLNWDGLNRFGYQLSLEAMNVVLRDMVIRLCRDLEMHFPHLLERNSLCYTLAGNVSYHSRMSDKCHCVNRLSCRAANINKIDVCLWLFWRRFCLTNAFRCTTAQLRSRSIPLLHGSAFFYLQFCFYLLLSCFICLYLLSLRC